MCVVSYASPTPTDDDNRVTFKKVYKFNVLKPLDIKSNIYKDEVRVGIFFLFKNSWCAFFSNLGFLTA